MGTLEYVPDHFKTEKMCERAVKDEPETLEFVLDHFKIRKMYDKTVKDFFFAVCPWLLCAQKQLKIWHDNNDYCNDDELSKWNEGHQKRKAQKAKIKEELMPITWHPSRWWDWCVPNDEKKRETEKLWK